MCSKQTNRCLSHSKRSIVYAASVLTQHHSMTAAYLFWVGYCRVEIVLGVIDQFHIFFLLCPRYTLTPLLMITWNCLCVRVGSISLRMCTSSYSAVCECELAHCGWIDVERVLLLLLPIGLKCRVCIRHLRLYCVIKSQIKNNNKQNGFIKMLYHVSLQRHLRRSIFIFVYVLCDFLKNQ